jgi:uroporphyrin-III C-methyltransferase
VTHRGAASAFVTISGHDERAWAPILEALPPHSATIVILMGLASRREIADRLLARGWHGHTPAAVLVAAGTPHAHTWMGTLGELVEEGSFTAGDGGGAGTIVVGEVVRVGQRLAGSLSARHDGQSDRKESADLGSGPVAAGRALAR